jgi:hypothetical protein
VARRWTRRRVRWRRWKRKERRLDSRWWDVIELPFDLGEVPIALAVVGVVLAVIAIVLLATFFVVPLLLALVDVLVIAAVLLVGAGARTLLGRPWEIEARTVGTPAEERTWRVRGWRASARAVDQVAQGFELGQRDPAPELAQRTD